jgi:hypothetical protein
LLITSAHRIVQAVTAVTGGSEPSNESPWGRQLVTYSYATRVEEVIYVTTVTSGPVGTLAQAVERAVICLPAAPSMCDESEAVGSEGDRSWETV